MYSDSELELIGAIIGDGHIHKSSKNFFGITGNKVTDKAYFQKLSFLVQKVWCKPARVFESGGGLRIVVYSKAVVKRLTETFMLPYNSGKCYVVQIPDFLADDYSRARHVLRGIGDTDGSVFVSDKKGSFKYPSLELTTVSEKLAVQLRGILCHAGFRVANLRSYKSKLATVKCYKVCLYGKKNLGKWVCEIGFSNPYKLGRAIAALSPTEHF